LWLAIDERELRQMQRRDSVRYYDGQGEPRFFSLLGNAIKVHPTPDAVYTIRHGYYTHIPKVTATTVSGLTATTLTIPAYYEGLAALFVAKHICLMFKDYNAYQAVTAEIKAQKATMDDNSLRSLAPRTPQTRSDG